MNPGLWVAFAFLLCAAVLHGIGKAIEKKHAGPKGELDLLVQGIIYDLILLEVVIGIIGIITFAVSLGVHLL